VYEYDKSCITKRDIEIDMITLVILCVPKSERIYVSWIHMERMTMINTKGSTWKIVEEKPCWKWKQQK
jgi:hypothetical protein